VEAYALMTSAYRMTEHAFAEGKCVEGFDSGAAPVRWEFLAVEGGMKGVGKSYQYLKRLLGVSNTLAFKIWKLRKGLQVAAVALALLILALGIWAALAFYDSVLVEAITVGAISMFVITLALTALGTALVGKKLMRVIRLRETLIRVAVGFGVGIFGWVAAAIHLLFFDPMFLREGSAENYRQRLSRADARARHDGAKQDPDAPAPRQETHASGRGAPAELPQRQAAPAPPEVVGAGVEVVPLPPAADAAGNGRGKESKPEPFPDQINIQDPEARQN
jgi:hypothetical protein